MELLLVDFTNEPFARIMRQIVLDPLGLTSSTFEQPLPEDLRARAASEHYDTERPFPGKRHHFPTRAAGGLWTDPSDLARFAIELIASRAGRSSRVLSQSMASEMVTPQVTIPNRPIPIMKAEGLGLGLTGEGETFAFLHTGATWGSTCLLWAHPETGQGTVVMTNARGGRGMIRFEILLAIAKEYGWPE